MTVEHVLAVVPVSDVDAARAWYEQLFDRPADNAPMPSLVEWQVVPGAWVQVSADAERAGSGLLNLAVDDLDAHLAQARSRGLQPGDAATVNKGVRIATLTDPDGNLIRLIGQFRVRY